MKRFLFLTLLSLGFAACNSLKLDDSDGALSGEVETSYISRDEGLRLLHGLETNLATSLQTPQEA